MHHPHGETCRGEPCRDPANGLATLADAMRGVTLAAAHPEQLSALDELVRAASAQVRGATAASVTMLRHGQLRTAASTGLTATRADALQFEAAGPCVGTAEVAVYRSDDVTCGDRRWRAWGARAHEVAGVTSALSYRLTVLGQVETTAALNIYSDRKRAFDERSVSTGLVLATHGSVLLTAMLSRDRAEHLRRALQSNREIGVAMGILMQRHALTRDQAFAVLRRASQDANRKLSHIATEVADTGTLAIRRRPGSGADTSGATVVERVPRTHDVRETAGGTASKRAAAPLSST